MKVYFQNNKGKELLLAEVENSDDAESVIEHFLDERDYVAPYMRRWKHDKDGKTRVYTDFGSHTEFIIVEY